MPDRLTRTETRRLIVNLLIRIWNWGFQFLKGGGREYKETMEEEWVLVAERDDAAEDAGIASCRAPAGVTPAASDPNPGLPKWQLVPHDAPASSRGP